MSHSAAVCTALPPPSHLVNVKSNRWTVIEKNIADLLYFQVTKPLPYLVNSSSSPTQKSLI